MSNIHSELIKVDLKRELAIYLSVVVYDRYNLFWVSKVDYSGKVLENNIMCFGNETLH